MPEETHLALAILREIECSLKEIKAEMDFTRSKFREDRCASTE